MRGGFRWQGSISMGIMPGSGCCRWAHSQMHAAIRHVHIACVARATLACMCILHLLAAALWAWVGVRLWECCLAGALISATGVQGRCASTQLASVL